MPFLKLAQPSPPTSTNASEETSWSDEQIQQTLIELERSNKTALLNSISEKHHGTIYSLNLSETPSSTSNKDKQDTHYFLTKPIFFGQLARESLQKALQGNKRARELAFLLNRMLEIYYERTDEFICIPEKGQMLSSVTNSATALGAFLLKADPQLIFPNGDENTPTAFIIELYQKHFLCQFVCKETVILMHFSNAQDRKNALDEICTQMKEEISKIGAERKSPSCPMVIESLRTEKESQNIPQLFVIKDYRPFPVGTKPDIPNFTTAYTLAEISRHSFIVEPERKLLTDWSKANFAPLYEQGLFTQLHPGCSTPISNQTPLMTHSHESTTHPSLPLQLSHQQTIQRPLSSNNSAAVMVGGPRWRFVTPCHPSIANPNLPFPPSQQHQPEQRQHRSNNPPAAQASGNQAMPIDRPQSRAFRLNIHAQPYMPKPSTTTVHASVAENSTTSSLKF